VRKSCDVICNMATTATPLAKWAEDNGVDEVYSDVRGESRSLLTLSDRMWQAITMSGSIHGVVAAVCLVTAAKHAMGWFGSVGNVAWSEGESAQELLRASMGSIVRLSVLLGIAALEAAYVRYTWCARAPVAVFVPLKRAFGLVEFDFVPTAKDLVRLNAAAPAAARFDIALYDRTSDLQKRALATDRGHEGMIAELVDSVLAAVAAGSTTTVDAAFVSSFESAASAYDRAATHFGDVAVEAGLTRAMLEARASQGDADVAELVARPACTAPLAAGAGGEAITPDQLAVLAKTVPLTASAVRVLAAAEAELAAYASLRVLGIGRPTDEDVLSGPDEETVGEVLLAFSASGERVRGLVENAVRGSGIGSQTATIRSTPDATRRDLGYAVKLACAAAVKVDAADRARRVWLATRDSVLRIAVTLPVVALAALEIQDALSRQHMGADEVAAEDCMLAVAAKAGLLEAAASKESALEGARQLLADPGNQKLRRAHRACVYDGRVRKFASATDNGVRVLVVIIVALCALAAVRSRFEKSRTSRVAERSALEQVISSLDELDDHTGSDYRMGAATPEGGRSFQERVDGVRRARLACELLNAARAPAESKLEAGQVVTYTIVAAACALGVMIAHKHLNPARQVTRIRELTGVQTGGGAAPRALRDEYDRLAMPDTPSELHAVSSLGFMAVCGYAIMWLLPEAL
jgi:hypothetical protein